MLPQSARLAAVLSVVLTVALQAQSVQLRSTTQLPRVYLFLPSSTPSGTSILEVYPEKDLEYEIRVVPRSGVSVPTRMRLYRDVAASGRRLYTRMGLAVKRRKATG